MECVNMFSPFTQFPSLPRSSSAITRVYPGGAESRTQLRGKITGYTGKTMEREGEASEQRTRLLPDSSWQREGRKLEQREGRKLKPHISAYWIVSSKK